MKATCSVERDLTSSALYPMAVSKSSAELRPSSPSGVAPRLNFLSLPVLRRWTSCSAWNASDWVTCAWAPLPSAMVGRVVGRDGASGETEDRGYPALISGVVRAANSSRVGGHAAGFEGTGVARG